MVREIADRNGGRLELDSQVGRGTCVRLLLPANRGDVPLAPESPPRGTPGHAADSLSLSVLLIEDEPDVRATLGEWFDLHGHLVTPAFDGNEALRRFEIGRFDVAVLDLGLPGMSGWDVAAALVDRQADLPIVLVTGWGVTLDPERLREAGVVEVLTKPVPPDRLVAVCLRIVRRARDEREGRATLRP